MKVDMLKKVPGQLLTAVREEIRRRQMTKVCQVAKAAQAFEEFILALFICYTHHQMGKYGRRLLAQAKCLSC